ncbi:Sphingolipid delta(4)-desaturase DES1-like [Chlorella vulgaris]
MGAPILQAARPPHHWTDSPEPHALRHKLMMQKYGPQIRALMGHNPWTVVPIAVACVLQTAIAAAVGVYDVSWLWTCILGYLISPFLAGNLMAAHHEISHFLVFKKPFWNRVLMVAANAPLGIPLGSLFKQYHQDHHSHMVSTAGAIRGMEGTDTGIWTEMEATWVDGTWQSKLALLIIFPIFFFFRPFFMCITKPLEALDAGSWLVVPAFDIALFYFSGMSVKPMAYLLLGLYFGVGLHPIAGHVISEHCMMMNDGQETHSCYDPLLNPLLYNFGYHVEHHDFLNIPWNRLPQLRKIAPEFYSELTSYPNWTYVIWKFVTDSSVGKAGVMTKRLERLGGTTGGASADKARYFTPASAMPLMRGITPTSIK